MRIILNLYTYVCVFLTDPPNEPQFKYCISYNNGRPVLQVISHVSTYVTRNKWKIKNLKGSRDHSEKLLRKQGACYLAKKLLAIPTLQATLTIICVWSYKHNTTGAASVALALLIFPWNI